MQGHAGREPAEKILRVASRLFSEKGYANVSIRDICRASGITAPVVYYYFGDKKGLFDAVARKQISMTDFIATLAEASSAAAPQAGLKAFIRVYLSSFPERAFGPGLYLRDSATLDKHSAQIASDDLDRIQSLALGLVRRCVKDGVFKDTDAAMAVDCLLGMLNRVIFQRIHFAKASDREAYGRFVTDFFFKAMS